MTLDLITILLIGCAVAILILVIMRIKALVILINSMIVDTFKRNGKWSVTRLTMGTAWFSVLYSYFYDLYTNGFNIAAFTVLVGVALGAKVTDAVSKKLNPEVKTSDPVDPSK